MTKKLTKKPTTKDSTTRQLKKGVVEIPMTYGRGRCAVLANEVVEVAEVQVNSTRVNASITVGSQHPREFGTPMTYDDVLRLVGWLK
jgi:hypothetical protein